MKVNMTQLASILGVTRKTVRSRMTRGLPIESKGSEGKNYSFDTTKVIEWHVEQELEGSHTSGPNTDPSLRDLRTKKLEAEVAITELNLASKLREVVLVEEAVDTIKDRIEVLSEHFQQLTPRVLPRVVGLVDEQAIRSILEDEINQLLNELIPKENA